MLRYYLSEDLSQQADAEKDRMLALQQGLKPGELDAEFGGARAPMVSRAESTRLLLQTLYSLMQEAKDCGEPVEDCFDRAEVGLNRKMISVPHFSKIEVVRLVWEKGIGSGHRCGFDADPMSRRVPRRK